MLWLSGGIAAVQDPLGSQDGFRHRSAYIAHLSKTISPVFPAEVVGLGVVYAP